MKYEHYLACLIIMKRNFPRIKTQKSKPSLKESLSYPLSPVSAVKSYFKRTKNLFISSKSPSNDNLSKNTSVIDSPLQYQDTKRSQLIKNKALLNEMGFNAQLDYKPINLEMPQNEIQQLYRIQITDFWPNKEKLKFLRTKGYLEAFREIVSENNKSKLYHQKTFKFPVSPKVLDINTSRKVTGKNTENSITATQSHRILEILPKTQESSMKSNEDSEEKLEKLNAIQIKCYKLSRETKELKTNAEKFSTDIKRQFNMRGCSNRKISRYELSKIRKQVDSLL
jgi:hypothetical protein